MKTYKSPIIAEKIQEGKIHEFQHVKNQSQVVNDLPVVAAGAAVVAAGAAVANTVHSWVTYESKSPTRSQIK